MSQSWGFVPQWRMNAKQRRCSPAAKEMINRKLNVHPGCDGKSPSGSHDPFQWASTKVLLQFLLCGRRASQHSEHVTDHRVPSFASTIAGVPGTPETVNLGLPQKQLCRIFRQSVMAECTASYLIGSCIA